MKKIIFKIRKNFDYWSFMWTCNKIMYPDRSRLFYLYRFWEDMKEAKRCVIKRCDNIGNTKMKSEKQYKDSSRMYAWAFIGMGMILIITLLIQLLENE